MVNNKKIICLIILIIGLSIGIYSTEKNKNIKFNIQEREIELTYEILPISSTEDMGILGIYMTNTTVKGLYYGLATYGALTGNRGGFFVVGSHAGIKQKSILGTISMGWFIGGGGGESAYPGSGFMSRPYMMLSHKKDKFNISIGVSHTKISEKNLGFRTILGAGYYFPSLKQENTRAFDSNQSNQINENISSNNIEIGIIVGQYMPKETILNRSKNKMESSLPILGLKLIYEIKGNLEWETQLIGAMTKSINGYAKVITGPSYKLHTNNQFKLKYHLLAGMSGGGGVDTGGGAIIQPGVSAQWMISKKSKINLSLDYIMAVNGAFNSPVIYTSYEWKRLLLRPKSNKKSIVKIDKELINIDEFKFMLGNRHYSPDSKYRDLNGNKYEPGIDLFGLAISYPIWRGFSGIGSSYWAFSGDVGAYAEGGFGIEYEYLVKSLNGSLRTSVEWLAAGGGGINVGTGLLIHYLIGYRYFISENHSLDFGFGHIHPLGTRTFEADTWTIGYTQKLTIPFLK